MTTNDLIAQYLGSAALFGVALIGWRVSLLNGNTYARYGREALAAVSTMSFVLMSIGLFSTMGIVAIETTRPAARVLYTVTFVTLALITLHAGAEAKVQLENGGKE